MEAHWIDLGTHASSVLAFEVAPWKDIEAFKSSDEDGVRWNEHAQRTFTCADIGARWKLRTQRAGLLKLLAGMIWARAGWAILT